MLFLSAIFRLIRSRLINAQHPVARKRGHSIKKLRPGHNQF